VSDLCRMPLPHDVRKAAHGARLELEARHARDAGPGVCQLPPAAAVDRLTGGHVAHHAVALMKAAPCSSGGGRLFSRTPAHDAF
jgi:hypothetical protein